MKPPKFDYHAPTAVADAAQLLSDLGDDTVILSGGQSLMPLLNLRLARPTDVVDLGRIDELRTITEPGNSGDFIEVGAMVSHHQMETSELVGDLAPLAQAAAGFIGYRAIRNRGTIGGSIAHADPAAEWPAVLLALDGEVTLASSGGERAPNADDRVGERVVKADDFFGALFTTARRSDELITSVRLATRFAHNWGFSEFQRRTGDFAVVMVAVACLIKESISKEGAAKESSASEGTTKEGAANGGVIEEVRIALGGVDDQPLRCPEAEAVLLNAVVPNHTGQDNTATEALALATAEAARDAVNPTGDLHGSADYRRQLVFAETQRAVMQALSQQGRPQQARTQQALTRQALTRQASSQQARIQQAQGNNHVEVIDA